MRRLLALFVLVAVVFIAGCGSSGSSGAGSPLATSLSYFPADSPFVMSVTTDPNSPAIKQLHGLEARLPIAAYGQAALMAKLSQLGLDYANDIRPLFGNPLIVGITAAGSGVATGQNFLVAWTTKDAGKLGALVKKITGGRSAGTRDGATLYPLGSSATLAVNGATLVLATTPAAVSAALDRHAHSSGLTEAGFSHALSSLPQDAFVRAYGNLSGLLARPSVAKARQVPWVAAIRGYAATMSATSSGINFSFRIDTTGRALSPALLPLAPGSRAPAFAGAMPITVGLENPSHTLSFIESAGEQTGARGFGSFLSRQAAVKRRTGSDVNDLLKLLTGHLIVASDTHTTLGRAALGNPGAGARVLAKLMSDPKALFTHAGSVQRLPGGFYSVTETGRPVTIGVADGQLLIGRASPAALRSFAASPTSSAAGAAGPVAFRISLAELIHLAVKRALPPQATSVLSSFGDITGWASDTASALSASATLTIH